MPPASRHSCSSAECGFDAAAFTRDVGAGILPSWATIATANSALPFDQKQRDWQVGGVVRGRGPQMSAGDTRRSAGNTRRGWGLLGPDTRD